MGRLLLAALLVFSTASAPAQPEAETRGDAAWARRADGFAASGRV